jgi:hypothetical protein
MTLTDTVVRARKSGAPLLGISTANQMGAVEAICNATDGSPKILWDCIRGFVGINDAGIEVIASFGDPAEVAQNSANPQTALEMMAKMPGNSDEPVGTIVFMLNAHRFVEDPFFSTGLLTLRDIYKTDFRSAILLGPQVILPSECQQDVVVIDDPLPDGEKLGEIITKVAERNGVPCPPETLERAVDATIGLSGFGCETVTAMSLRKNGIDLDALRARKRTQVNQTIGVTLLDGGPKFDDVQGYDQIKEFLARLAATKRDRWKFRCVIWIDELEKHFAGLGQRGGPGDNTGITQKQLGEFLTWTERVEAMAMILVGFGGTGKSFLAQAVGPTFDRQTAMLNFSELTAGIAGQSEMNTRNALKTLEAVASGRPLIIATCNKLDVLPPELRRRFSLGIWYFDPPTKDERNAIWQYQLGEHDLDFDSAAYPDDSNWTGAEIRNCCRIAAQLDVPLIEAASFVVPLAKAEPKALEELRANATGRFLSASSPGTYKPKQEYGGTRKVATS